MIELTEWIQSRPLPAKTPLILGKGPSFGHREQFDLRQFDFSRGRHTVGRGSSIGGVIIAIWLIIGVIAAGQRGYFDSDEANCAKAGTILVTIIAGPLNYMGVNPKINCNIPQPSK